MSFLREIKKEIYNSELIKRQFQKYCTDFGTEQVNNDNSVNNKIIEIKGDKFYTLNSSIGKIYFNVDDNNLEEDSHSNFLKNCDNAILNEAISTQNFIGNGGAIFDIGANLGVFSFVFARCGAKIYGFEANKLNYKQLIKTANFNKFDCEFYNFAVVDKKGEYKFQSHGPWGYLIDNFDSPDYDEKKVSIINGQSIDDWYSENKIKEEIKLIKMDIEGSELKALAGMKNFLKEKNYPPFFVESNACHLALEGVAVKDFIEKFKELGYRPYFIKDSNTVEIFNNEYQLRVVENFLMVNENNTRILEGKDVIECRKYSDKEFFEYATKADMVDVIVFLYAFELKNSEELLSSPLAENFINFHKKFKEPYNKKVNFELIELLKRNNKIGRYNNGNFAKNQEKSI